MLLLPDKGIRVSSSHHNVELDIFCDWIEGCVLFGELPLSTTDFIDVLLENNVYRDQDFAAQLLENAWAELHRRNRCIGETSFYDLRGKRITPLQSWKQAPAYSFCLLLSLVKAYSAWSTQNGNTGYTEQGELFELLTKESLEIQLTGWHIRQMGWSRGNPKSLHETVEEILDLLGERVGDVETWASRTAKDYGLDLLCFKPFVDGRAGVPVYLLQCASGQNWQTKVLDLLHKSKFKMSIDQTRNEAEAQREASAPVAVGLFDDAPYFQRADDVFDSDAKTSQRTVMGFVFRTELTTPGFSVA